MNRNLLNVLQIMVAVIMMGLILLQAKGGGLGSTFGGFGGVYRSKRGVEKMLYLSTILVSLVFFVLAVVSFIFFS